MAEFKAMLAAAGVMAALAAPALAAEKAADKAPPGDVAAGQTLFNQRCGICHVTQDDGKQHPAPNLRGVVGRKAASYPGFNYSPALKASGITWTSGKIYQFLTGPQMMVPGTFMVITVPKDDERANVVAYLASLKK
jgi:cytochrome c